MSKSPSEPVDPRLLTRFVPLNSLGAESLRRLANGACIRSVPAGRTLFRVGDVQSMASYLVDGEVQLIDAQGGVVAVLKGDDDQARQSLASPPAATVSALCLASSKLLIVDSGLLDVLLTWEQAGEIEVATIAEVAPDEASRDWMIRLLQTPSFQRLPPANLQALFQRMQAVEVVAGERVVRQGEAGDYFYIVTEGRCRILHQGRKDQPLLLAELGPGDTFGEDALIADRPRNASAEMLTAGRLMRLARQDFLDLLNEPLLTRLDREAAQVEVDAGRARWLDVRLPSEFEAGQVAGSLNLPLVLLRPRLSQLDRDCLHICVCDTGRRSAVAAFVLGQRGFRAAVLAGGLGNDHWSRPVDR